MIRPSGVSCHDIILSGSARFIDFTTFERPIKDRGGLFCLLVHIRRSIKLKGCCALACRTSPSQCGLQGFFEFRMCDFEPASGALISGSVFDGFAGLGFSRAAALVVRSLKDMIVILFGFSAGRLAPRSGATFRKRLIYIWALTGRFTMAGVRQAGAL